jgi:opacity protein-like surface antigen
VKKFIALLFLAGPCFGAVNVSLLGGGAFPLSDLEIEGGGSEKIGESGGAIGVQLMVPIDEQISVGFDFLNQAFGEKKSDSLIPTARTTYQFSSRTFLAGVRYTMKKEKWHPFLFGGLGVGYLSGTADLEPAAGYIWSDTGTAEKRKILDDSGAAAAVALAFGADYAVTPRFSFGAEGRFSYIGKTTFTTRSISTTTSTVGEIKGNSSSFALLARGTLHF